MKEQHDSEGGGGTKTGRKSRKEEICRDVIKAYREAFCLNKMGDFVGSLAEYRGFREQERQDSGEQRGKRGTVGLGPDRRTIQAVLDEGKATGETEDTILGMFQRKWDKMHEKSGAIPGGLPRPVSLRRWPEGYWRAAEDEPASAGKTLSREDYFMQVCRMIRHAERESALYTSVGAGFWVKNLMDALGSTKRPKIELVIVRRMSQAYIGELVRLGLLAGDFWENLCNNLRLLREKRYGDGRIEIKEQVWRGMSPFHGTMYGQEVLFRGPWQFGQGGLNTVEGPIYRLASEDGDLFKVSRRLLMRGDGGK